MNKTEIMTRASKWAIHTIQINHKYRQLLPLAMSKKNKHERSIIAIQQAKILKKYILSYMCYLFGASYQNCIINNFKIKDEKSFYKEQLINFFKVVKNYYYHPEQSMQFFDDAEEYFGKRHKLVNSTIFASHMPKLNKSDIDVLVDFFISYKKKPLLNYQISNIFHGARHYFHIEKQGFFYKLKKTKKKTLATQLMTARLKTMHFKNFKKSGLDRRVALRNSYFYLLLLHNNLLVSVFLTYQLESKIKKKNINKIITSSRDVLDLVNIPEKMWDNENEKKK